MTLTKTRKGFTLVELLVVVAMIAVIVGSMTTSINSAQQRARIQKATSEVKVISQAIIAYAEYNNGKLETTADSEADANTLGFLIGKGGADSFGNEIPALLMASLSSGGAMLDPWGTPYHVTIKNEMEIKVESPFTTLETGYCLPNFYRLSAEERK